MNSPNISEEKVGKAFKKLGITVYYQFGFGPYTLDIFLPKFNVCVEIYGPHHLETKRQLLDRTRQQYIEAKGVKFYIITAQQANTVDGVRNLVDRVLKENNIPAKTKKEEAAFNGLNEHLDRWVNSTGFTMKPVQSVPKESIPPKEEDFASLLDKYMPAKQTSKKPAK